MLTDVDSDKNYKLQRTNENAINAANAYVASENLYHRKTLLIFTFFG